MRPRERRDARWVAALIAVSLAVVTAARVVVNEPALAISFLSLLPICVAAYRFGRPGALVVAALSTGLFLVEEVAIRASEELRDSRLAVATASRLVVFFGVGLLVAELLRRQDRLSRTVAEQEGEIGELVAIRDALTPPSVPPVPRLRVATAYAPAEGLVAGDFFLVVPGSDGSALLAVGDVVGHGLAAARRAAFVRATLASFADYASDPAELVRLANVALYERGGDTVEFVTVTCLRVTPDDGGLAWAQAGHPPPWDLDRGEPLADWKACPPLGIEHDIPCATKHARLAPGGGVLLFSDGLVEARPTVRGRGDAPRRLFGEDAVREELLRHRGAPVEEVLSALTGAATRFAGGALADDLTLLAARVDQAA